MRIARVDHRAEVRAAIVAGGAVRVLGSGIDPIDLLSADPAGRERLVGQVEAELPLDAVRLLAPIAPPTLRDFSVFEQHIEGLIKDANPEATVPPVWYESPFCYFTNPHAVTGPGEKIPVPPGCRRLDLELAAEVNGSPVGTDTLANMAWSFPELVSYASRGTWVCPGDVLGSGTCGNGCLLELWGRGHRGLPALTPGDVVSLHVAGIGTLSNPVVAGVEPHPLPRARSGRRAPRPMVR